ncbi:metallopeptidase TldD-related protein [Streptomyces sp. S.PB5]|uniref:metallopeptidase TldD-related protein n=1 Tax=Streptomyces sp. S.PB5 TaxID=3020844 RepID=UPI0025B257D8|nr:metallopeptidase TldD-related protein [Streptomyces sp. S.PB5]MDN3023618.1 metallopeptidase TldD-related protein [Streptomyces sp. S.PB5]
MTATTTASCVLDPSGTGDTTSAEPDDHGCVTVRSHRITTAAGTRSGGASRIGSGRDHAEETTAALLLDGSAGPKESAVRYAAVRGSGSHAVRDAVRLAAERLGRPWPAPALAPPPGSALVTRPHPDRQPAELVEKLLGQLSFDGFEVAAQAHVTTESRLLIPAGRTPVGETVHTGAAVIDVLRGDSLVADVDVAWSGDVLPDIDQLGARVEQALKRAGAPRRAVPSRVQMLLVDGSAGALLHEVCGHLLESSRQRPSLLARHRSRQVAHHQLSVDDNPRHDAGFGSHRYTLLGTDTRRRSLLSAGLLAGLLEDCPHGPWRAEDARRMPQPRMSHLELTPAPCPVTLDRALGNARAPIVRVHRLGAGSLDHRDGTVVLEVKDATYVQDSGLQRLPPFRVTAEARQVLLGIQAVGGADTMATWSAYCLATSGRLPVGASTPTVLTGPLTTLEHGFPTRP